MQKIILFDGVCNFCNWNVQFIIKRDPKKYFAFASLQSNFGQQVMSNYDIPVDEDSIILIEQNQFYSKSTAVLKICKHLTFPWKILYIFVFIPKPIRDYVYQIVSQNRYRWFGKRGQCSLPTSKIRKRFFF